MKIGKLQFKSFAAEKPLMITADGRMLSVKQVAETPALSLGSLFSLDEDLQVELAATRYAMEPDYKLGVVGLGIFTRDEIIFK